MRGKKKFTGWGSEGVKGKIFDITEAKDHPTHSVKAQLHLPVLTAFGSGMFTGGI